MKKLNKKQLIKLHGKEYVERYHSRDYIRIKRLVDCIKFNVDDKILDIGCGNGLLLDYLEGKIDSYCGVDFSKEFINIARKKKVKIKNVRFVCGDVVKFCKKSKFKFDKVFALDFVEHIYDEDFIKIFSAVHDSIGTGGQIYIHTPNKDYLIEILKDKGIMKQFPEHIAVRNSKQYLDLLKKAGFKNVEIVFLPHYLWLLSIFDFLRYVPLISKYFKARLFIICKK